MSVTDIIQVLLTFLFLLLQNILPLCPVVPAVLQLLLLDTRCGSTAAVQSPIFVSLIFVYLCGDVLLQGVLTGAPVFSLQQEVSVVAEEEMQLDGGPSPPPVQYEGPAFPPEASCGLPAQDQAPVLGPSQQRDPLEERLVEW